MAPALLSTLLERAVSVRFPPRILPLCVDKATAMSGVWPAEHQPDRQNMYYVIVI